MSVKRFDISGEHYEVFGDNNGEYCLYDDYAALESRCQSLQELVSAAEHAMLFIQNKETESEARCAALAAELRAVEAIHNEAVFITDEHYEQCPPEVKKIIRSLAVLQIPAYQAFLAEVRASAIDSLVDIKKKQLADMHPDTHAFGATAMSIRSQINELQVFAAQIRKGVQS